jgi:hypothetical protein
MTSPVSRTCGARHATSIAADVLLVLLSPLLTRPASAQPPQEQKYLISIGTAAERLPSGTLWLYSYSWYGLQQFKLAAIHDGLAIVPLDRDRLKREADPHPNTSACVVVIQAGEHRWYRTPDISPDDFWADVPGAIRSLGKTADLPGGETRLILPPLSRRRITLLDPTGRPNAITDLTVSIYLWDQNHCGVHEGLPLGEFRTDAKGTIEVIAPLVPLYLDGLQYLEEAGSGPAGPAYSGNTGMKIAADQTVVIQAVWKVPQFTAQLQVLTLSGRPRPHVDVYGSWNTNTCGGHDRMAETDARGIVRLDLDATFIALTLMIGGPYSANDLEGDKNTRRLSDAELRELFTRHKLTIRW